MNRVRAYHRRVTIPPASLEDWVNGITPGPLELDLKHRDQDLLAFAEEVQACMKKEESWGGGYPDAIYLYRAAKPNKRWQIHEFSSWTSSPDVAREFAEDETGEPVRDILELRVPVENILWAPGCPTGEFGYPEIDLEYVVMHNIPQRLPFNRVRVYQEKEWL